MNINISRKGYFFTLDVFIAVIILMIGLIAIFSISYYSPGKDRTEFLSKGVVDVLSELQIADVCNDTSPPCTCSYVSVKDACDLGYFSDGDMTVMEMLALLYSLPVEQQRTSAIVQEIFIDGKVLPENFMLELILYDPAHPDSIWRLYP